MDTPKILMVAFATHVFFHIVCHILIKKVQFAFDIISFHYGVDLSKYIPRTPVVNILFVCSYLFFFVKGWFSRIVRRFGKNYKRFKKARIVLSITNIYKVPVYDLEIADLSSLLYPDEWNESKTSHISYSGVLIISKAKKISYWKLLEQIQSDGYFTVSPGGEVTIDYGKGEKIVSAFGRPENAEESLKFSTLKIAKLLPHKTVIIYID